jgi:hypothetical protein
LASETEQEFMKFMAKHKRSYGTKEEYYYRLGLFTHNYEKIKKHNNGNGV